MLETRKAPLSGGPTDDLPSGKKGHRHSVRRANGGGTYKAPTPTASAATQASKRAAKKAAAKAAAAAVAVAAAAALLKCKLSYCKVRLLACGVCDS